MRRKSVGKAAALGLAVLLVAFASASDAALVARTDVVLHGPFPAGTGVTWEEATDSGYEVFTKQPGRRVARLASGALTNCDQLEDPACEASACRLCAHRSISTFSQSATLLASPRWFALAFAAGESSQYGGSDSRSVSAAALRAGAGQRSIARCSSAYMIGDPPPAGVVHAASALDGDFLAVICNTPLRIYDLRAPGSGPVEIPGTENVSSLRLAGIYVAGVVPHPGAPATIQVWDRQTGQPVYEVPETGAGYALESDGTVVVASPGPSSAPCSGRLAWYSIAEPTAHELAVHPCTARVAADGGRIAYVSGSGGLRELSVIDHAGTDGPIAVLPRLHLAITDDLAAEFAASEGRLAFGQSLCDGDIGLTNVAFGAGSPPNLACPASIASLRARIHRGDIVVRLRCRQGCQGRAVLRVGSVARRKGFSLGPSRRGQALDFHFGRRAAATLAGRTARLTWRVANLDGSARTGRANVRIAPLR
jgi:hypothetical protein